MKRKIARLLVGVMALCTVIPASVRAESAAAEPETAVVEEAATEEEAAAEVEAVETEMAAETEMATEEEMAAETEMATEEEMAAESDMAEEEDPAMEREYPLEQVVILSRHNIRSPLSEKGSVVASITPHEWFTWTSKPGELSLRGAMLETTMGQFFRLWLEDEGLFPENYIPEEGAVRFYANGYQRTQATAHYFSTGLLPVAVVPVECKNGYNVGDDTFFPIIHFMSDEYEQVIRDEIAEKRNGEGLTGYREALDDAINLLAEVTDMADSEEYQSGMYGNILVDDTEVTLFQDDEPRLSGAIKTASAIADAMILQYYEETDDKKAAFGHDITWEDWTTIGSVMGAYEDILFSAPSLAPNLAHDMLEEIYSELNTEGRQFTFLCGHDSTIYSFLKALGAEDYTLPGAIEPYTPIGVKVVFERWRKDTGEVFYHVSLVYQSVEQMRTIQMLSPENPPMIVPLSFEGIETNELGMIAQEDLMNLFEEKIRALGEIEEEYAEELAPAA